jgi:dihydroneopterin aldolase
MADLLTLRGLTAQGRHGWFPEETERGQRFVVDLTLEVDTRAAAASDDLADTVDYGSLASEVIALVEGEPVKLIETLADRVAALCLARDGVQRVEVTIHKPEAPVAVPFEDVTLSIRRSRP